jgi:type IV pilus assembly protein PilX
MKIQYKNQHGVVLIISLILLVIISLTALIAMKGSISSEQVSNNMRTNAVAMQASETALRFCENQLLSGTTTLIVHELDMNGSEAIPTLWASRSNWTALKSNTATSELTNSQNSAGRSLTMLPQCMIERYPLVTLQGGATRESYLITSRGYSPNYAVNAAGQVISGGEIWLQSILRF